MAKKKNHMFPCFLQLGNPMFLTKVFVKSPLLEELCPEYKWDNHHLTSPFCKVELDPTEILRWYQSLSNLLGHLL